MKLRLMEDIAVTSNGYIHVIKSGTVVSEMGRGGRINLGPRPGQAKKSPYYAEIIAALEKYGQPLEEADYVAKMIEEWEKTGRHPGADVDQLVAYATGIEPMETEDERNDHIIDQHMSRDIGPEDYGVGNNYPPLRSKR